jgi:hypothetical protein
MLKIKYTLLAGMLCVSTLLSACDTLPINGKESEKQGMCRDLKSQKVFGGLNNTNKQNPGNNALKKDG